MVKAFLSYGYFRPWGKRFSFRFLPDSLRQSKAKIVVMEYFSFGCESCIRLFKEDFEYFRRKYIDTGHVQWIFHPHPVDLITIQGMACLAKLEKKISFLEAVFSRNEPQN